MVFRIKKEKGGKMEELRFVNFISGGGTTNLEVLKAEKNSNNNGGLVGLTKTVAIIASSEDAAGIDKALEAGFPEENIHVVKPENSNFTYHLNVCLQYYEANYFHQLGWMPFTPSALLKYFNGLNQHFGPGGKGMFGVRRAYVHLEFCKQVDRKEPVSIFCQRVARKYDEGAVISLRKVDIDFKMSPEEVSEFLLPIEHEVQIEGRAMLSRGNFVDKEVPRLAKNEKEMKLLENLKKEAVRKYPNT
ncbi:hypothetical protein C0583_00695 [Candidatus Parcubacteria bacterium]|nr:MAG: hypothetical protein C0583_00695 [Candidatus Parcubacteria bacterium]